MWKTKTTAVNIGFVAKVSGIRNLSENTRSDVKTSEVATLYVTDDLHFDLGETALGIDPKSRSFTRTTLKFYIFDIH